MRKLCLLFLILLLVIQPVTAFAAEESGKEAFAADTSLIVALVAGVIVALIVVLCLRSQLKSVRFNRTAENYMVEDSLRLTQSTDLFLYQTVTRVQKPQNNQNRAGKR